MFTVQAFVTTFTGSAEKFADNTGGRNLRQALRLAWEVAGGIPGAWVGIRHKGELIADLETNYRGELSEANVYARQRTGGKVPVVLVTPLNPAGPIFAGVFAG